ncbi:MAG: ribonuclease PH [Planctomycetaceae bacterium]|nr:ribonuclease PH [Planctomycetaceae bacterium]
MSTPAIRPVSIVRGFTKNTPGSVLYQCGDTVVLCTASLEQKVPDWMVGRGKGWITAEYNMLPGSTPQRKARERSGKVDGRTTEIQRLIGRSFRAIADLQKLGERSLTIDCDVLQADGGTRTAAITGGMIALIDAVNTVFSGVPSDQYPLRDSVAAISVGIVDSQAYLDLDYAKDVRADVDMNVVMTGKNRFVEIQGTGEEATFDDQELSELLKLAKIGISQLHAKQKEAVGEAWPWIEGTQTHV